MIEILFILHVVNGIHITIHNVDTKKYNYMNSKTNTSIIIRIFVSISLIILKLVQILFYQFLENGNRYRLQTFMVNYFFKRLSNDISFIFVA